MKKIILSTLLFFLTIFSLCSCSTPNKNIKILGTYSHSEENIDSMTFTQYEFTEDENATNICKQKTYITKLEDTIMYDTLYEYEFGKTDKNSCILNLKNVDNQKESQITYIINDDMIIDNQVSFTKQATDDIKLLGSYTYYGKKSTIFYAMIFYFTKDGNKDNICDWLGYIENDGEPQHTLVRYKYKTEKKMKILTFFISKI